MKLNFEFKDSNQYFLMLNNKVYKTYSKVRHSKREAEEKALQVVNSSIKKHGVLNVDYVW